MDAVPPVRTDVHEGRAFKDLDQTRRTTKTTSVLVEAECQRVPSLADQWVHLGGEGEGGVCGGSTKKRSVLTYFGLLSGVYNKRMETDV